MTNKEYFTNRINVFDVPKLNKEQFLYIIKIISLESEIKKLKSLKGLINIKEPKIIQLRQWWKTKDKEGL